MQKKLKPVMLVGTGSDVGKSIVNAGLCRIFLQDGYSPAPYKAQNMSLNSYATPLGFEIGRAQAVQAEACKIECSTDMNPVLLKPTNNVSSQVVLNGKPYGNQSAHQYFMGEGRIALFEEVKKAFYRLANIYNPIVMEGAGSISELNLKHRDITNMSIACEVEASVYLVADIDRGGVFASVYGTLELLSPVERKRIKGIIINKFRGDIKLFDDGIKIMEDLCKIPVVGIIPFYNDIYIEDEDSVALKNKNTKASESKINVAVVLLQRMSNFTDFNALEYDERVHLYFSKSASEIGKADIIIIPGSKNTIADLIEIKSNGIANAITSAYRLGKTVIGICGGFQIMGGSIKDPFQVEGLIEEETGLGILPVETVITESKTTIQNTFKFKNYDTKCEGYEIHMGETFGNTFSPLNTFLDGTTDGYAISERCWGTYIHGILDNKVVIDDLLLPYISDNKHTEFDYKKFKEQQYERLANHLRMHIDMDLIYNELIIK